MKRIILLLVFASGALLAEKPPYPYRNYQHVKQFYKEIIPYTIDICVKHNLPPAAVLAMAGLESGFGSGYVSKITGNILSLGAFRGDKELPSLYLPYSQKDRKVIFLQENIEKHSKKDLVYKQREKSLKRDYRPKRYAGTIKNLEILVYNKELRANARISCINDFATRWIALGSNVKVFRNTKKYLNNIVRQKDKKILFEDKVNKDFINKIGGIKSSFNYRKTWPKKVNQIMKKTGLVMLVQDIYINKKSFNDAWE